MMRRRKIKIKLRGMKSKLKMAAMNMKMMIRSRNRKIIKLWFATNIPMKMMKAWMTTWMTKSRRT
jgi:hypothetical protein